MSFENNNKIEVLDDDGTWYSQTFNPDKRCENCNTKGAFFIDLNPIVGVCFNCLTNIVKSKSEWQDMRIIEK